MNLANLNEQKDKLAQELDISENENASLKEQISKLSDDLVVAKTNLGTVMNAVFEFGGADLFDQIEERVTFGEHQPTNDEM